MCLVTFLLLKFFTTEYKRGFLKTLQWSKVVHVRQICVKWIYFRRILILPKHRSNLETFLRVVRVVSWCRSSMCVCLCVRLFILILWTILLWNGWWHHSRIWKLYAEHWHLKTVGWNEFEIYLTKPVSLGKLTIPWNWLAFCLKQ